ncbi:MAG: hypothetical protein ACHP9Y_03760, partial [Gammaproteobacteria bacterium]
MILNTAILEEIQACLTQNRMVDFSEKIAVLSAAEHLQLSEEDNKTALLQGLVNLVEQAKNQRLFAQAIMLANIGAAVFLPDAVDESEISEIDDESEIQEKNSVIAETLSLIKTELSEPNPDWVKIDEDFNDCLDERWLSDYLPSTVRSIIKVINLATAKKAAIATEDAQKAALHYEQDFNRNLPNLDENSLQPLELAVHNIDLGLIWLMHSELPIRGQVHLTAAQYLGRARQQLMAIQEIVDNPLLTGYIKLQKMRLEMASHMAEILNQTNLLCNLVNTLDHSALSLSKLLSIVLKFFDQAELLRCIEVRFQNFHQIFESLKQAFLTTLESAILDDDKQIELYEKLKDQESRLIIVDVKWVENVYRKMMQKTRKGLNLSKLALTIRRDLNVIQDKLAQPVPMPLPVYSSFLVSSLEKMECLQRLPDNRVFNEEAYAKFSRNAQTFLGEILENTVSLFQTQCDMPAAWAVLGVGSITTHTMHQGSDYDLGAVIIRSEINARTIPYIRAILSAVKQQLILLAGEGFNLDSDFFSKIMGEGEREDTRYNLIQTGGNLSLWLTEGAKSPGLSEWLTHDPGQLKLKPERPDLELRLIWSLYRSTLLYASPAVGIDESYPLFQNWQSQLTRGLAISATSTSEDRVSRSYQSTLIDGKIIYPQHKCVAVALGSWVEKQLQTLIQSAFYAQQADMKTLYWKPLMLYIQWLGLYHACIDPSEQ